MKIRFFDEVPPGVMIKRYHGVYKKDWYRDKILTCVVPFNVPIILCLWVGNGFIAWTRSVVLDPHRAFKDGREFGRNEMQESIDLVGTENHRMKEILTLLGMKGIWENETYNRLSKLTNARRSHENRQRKRLEREARDKGCVGTGPLSVEGNQRLSDDTSGDNLSSRTGGDVA